MWLASCSQAAIQVAAWLNKDASQLKRRFIDEGIDGHVLVIASELWRDRSLQGSCVATGPGATRYNGILPSGPRHWEGLQTCTSGCGANGDKGSQGMYRDQTGAHGVTSGSVVLRRQAVGLCIGRGTVHWK